MESRGIRTCLSIGIGMILLAAVFVAGIGVGYFVPPLLDSGTPASGPISCPPCPTIDADAETPEEYQALFAPFWQVWDIIHEDYVDQPVDQLDLMRGAIRGMLESLGDRHTSYMTPEEFQQASEALEGEYEGIGAWVDITGDYVEIISPMPGSPAAEAGLRPKDIIIGIDGEDMTGIPGDVVLSFILGPAGTDVDLTIQRGNEVFDVTITRATIIVPTVEYEMLEDDIAYVGLYNYGEKTTEQLREALQSLLAEDPVGMILDLRGNGGGYLNTAIQVVSEFVGEGAVMYEQYGDGDTLVYEAIPGGLATEIPLVVLVDQGTASAAEITAGAIQDLGRGPLVGMTTFGKGSVQTWRMLTNNAGGVRVTIARWLTPDGRQISNVGLEPEFIVEMTEEDFIEGLDPQLDKAIEVLSDLLQ